MIDLRNCVKGQKLLCSTGEVVTYIGPLPEGNYYDHEIMYSNGSLGTRTHDGYVYRNPAMRLPQDHNIVDVVKQSDTELVMEFMKRKSDIIKSITGVCLLTKKDENDLSKMCSKDNFASVFMEAIRENSDSDDEICPWCVSNNLFCDKCSYGKRNGYCQEYNSKYTKVMEKLIEKELGSITSVPEIQDLIEEIVNR